MKEEDSWGDGGFRLRVWSVNSDWSVCYDIIACLYNGSIRLYNFRELVLNVFFKLYNYNCGV